MKKEFLFVGGPYSGQKLLVEEDQPQVVFYAQLSLTEAIKQMDSPDLGADTYTLRAVATASESYLMYVHAGVPPVQAMMDACQKKLPKKLWYKQLDVLRSLVSPSKMLVKEVDWGSYYDQGYSPLEAYMEMLGISFG